MSPRPRRGSKGVAHEFARASWLGAFCALLLLTLGASLVGYHYLHRQMVDHLRNLATLTAIQAQAAVLFEDPHNASEILATLPETGVAHAELRTESGAVLAEYVQPETPLRTRLGRWLEPETIHQDVLLDGRRIGTLALIGSNEALVDALAGLILADVLAAVLIGVLSIFLTTRHARRVSEPLTRLTTLMRQMIQRGNYAERAPPATLAEADELRTQFNELLDQIMQRDHELMAANAALERLALHDALTGLPNRAMFEQALAQLPRGDAATQRNALLYLDVDNFKNINDRLGHGAGDSVLVAVGQRLQSWLPDGGIAARIGGDEFVILLTPLARDADVRSLVADLRRRVEATLPIGNEQLQPRVSIGYAVHPDDGPDIEQLPRHADRAMYAEKHRRRSTDTPTDAASNLVEDPHAYRSANQPASPPAGEPAPPPAYPHLTPVPRHGHA